MRNVQLGLSVLDDLFSVYRSAPDAEIPHWVPKGSFASVTRTADDLSIVCLSDAVPDTVRT